MNKKITIGTKEGKRLIELIVETLEEDAKARREQRGIKREEAAQEGGAWQ